MAFHTRYANNRKWWWHTPRHHWIEYRPGLPASYPKAPVCYVLTLDGVVIYVGQTTDFRSRFYTHRIKMVGDNEWKTSWGVVKGDLRLKVKFSQRYGDWCMREARLIDRLQPKFNFRRI